MNSMQTCNSATFYFMKKTNFLNVSSKSILPNMIGEVTAPIKFGKKKTFRKKKKVPYNSKIRKYQKKKKKRGEQKEPQEGRKKIRQ